MNKKKKNDLSFEKDKIYFIPLGGSEQFGVNFNVYGYNDRWIIVDCGIGFADHRYPGADIFLPDPEFITGRRDKLAALIITHAHEDHIGAVPYLWPQFRCPIYCTEFTATVLRQKFQEYPECKDAEIHVIAEKDIFKAGSFDVQALPVSHSIPGTVSLVLKTDHGSVLHSGDWNLDPSPVLGNKTSEKDFKALGKENILAYIGDSTNADSQKRLVSEKDVGEGLQHVFKDCSGRIVITIFSSNIGRIQSIAKAAQNCDRCVCVIGRSLQKMISAAKACGYLSDIPDFISEEDAGYLPEDKVLMIATGSQGEGRAQLARIAHGTHPNIALNTNDTVIFSARAIPGNEKDINAVKNALAAGGVKVVTPSDTDHVIHVSGHPYPDEIDKMLDWVKPKTVIPVHGERLMLEAQAKLARKKGIEAIVPNNGSILEITKDGVHLIDHVPTGILAVEPGRIVKGDDPSIAQRRKLQYSGVVHLSIVMSARGDLVTKPHISTIGLVNSDSKDGQDFEEDLLEEIEDILADMTREELYDDHFVTEELRIGTRRFVNHFLRMKPSTTVHLTRI